MSLAVENVKDELHLYSKAKYSQGFITDMLGRIPEESEHPVVTYQNVEFTVIRTEEHRIEKVHAKILLPPEEPEKE